MEKEDVVKDEVLDSVQPGLRKLLAETIQEFNSEDPGQDPTEDYAAGRRRLLLLALLAARQACREPWNDHGQFETNAKAKTIAAIRAALSDFELMEQTEPVEEEEEGDGLLAKMFPPTDEATEREQALARAKATKPIQEIPDDIATLNAQTMSKNAAIWCNLIEECYQCLYEASEHGLLAKECPQAKVLASKYAVQVDLASGAVAELMQAIEENELHTELGNWRNFPAIAPLLAGTRFPSER